MTATEWTALVVLVINAAALGWLVGFLYHQRRVERRDRRPAPSHAQMYALEEGLERLHRP